MISSPTHESAEEFAPLVACLIEAGFATSDDWVAWATCELVRAEGAPIWLAELTTTYDVHAALALLVPLRGRPTVEDRLGCLWLAYRGHHISSIELLEQSLEAAGGWDTGGGFIPYQRELMALLRRVEALSQSEQGDAGDTLIAVEKDAGDLLAPLGQRVRQRTAGRIGMSGLRL